MNAITVFAGRTGRILIISVVAASTNVGLNLALVPQFGAIAAAVNTTIGYGLLLAGAYLYMRHVCDPPIQYHVGRIVAGVLVISLPTAAASALVPDDSLSGLAIRTVMLLAIALLLLGWPLRSEAHAAWLSVRATRTTQVL